MAQSDPDSPFCQREALEQPPELESEDVLASLPPDTELPDREEGQFEP